MSSANERRKNARLPCEAPILHNTCPADFFYRGTVYNFCKGGLYFESNEDLLQGHEVTISMKNPPLKFGEKSHQYFDVKIIWCRELQGSTYLLSYGAKLI